MSAAPGSSAGAIRGHLVYFVDDPFLVDRRRAFVEEADGIVWWQDGTIAGVGPAEKMRRVLPAGLEPDTYPGCIVSAGLIDTHIHYVQTGIVAAYAEQLLDWLRDHAFPAETAFADEAVARRTATFFCEELLRNGTTTAMVFCSVHPVSVDALFAEAERRGMRLIAGKVLMDRNAPPALLDTPQSAYDQSKALIGRWHGRGRALYAITPRFAPTSSPEQLEMAGALRREHPEVYVQTHIAENRAEIAWVKELFPDRTSYLDVYHHHGLAGRRTMMAHGVHLSEEELCSCHETGTALSHCPTSNLFLGSGLFRMRAAKDPRRPVDVGLGTDIGGGTSFSLLATMGEAYKVAQADGFRLNALKAFYLATLGGARALALDDRIGTLQPGREADITVLDPAATELMRFRNERSRSVDDQLFALMTLGDDRAIRATYVGGRLAYLRPEDAGAP